MRKFLKFLLIILCIAVIAALIWMADYYVEDNQQTNSNNVQTENVGENNVNTQVKEENKNEVEEKNEEENSQEKEDDVDENLNEETNISDEDKAIDLAKKEYGTTNGVYFRVEQIQSDNTYIVSVRDSETTKDLAWYTVNVKNGTVK